MTVNEVKKRVKAIAAMTGDEEAAHGMEDRLYIDVLTFLGQSPQTETGKLARAALKTREIKFPRWCA